jgi:8-oxo-dGTP pyrophosphatase MutT (NUDIX family)
MLTHLFIIIKYIMHCAGFIIFRQNKDTYDVTIVTTKSGNAGLPKGKRKKHETNLKCAYRELYEETSIMKDEIELIDNCIFSEKSVIYYVTKYIDSD